MDREQASRLLRSASPHERLKAARYFRKNSTAADKKLIRQRLKVETVSWVKRALSEALDSAQRAPTTEPAGEDLAPQEPQEEATKQIYARAMEEVTGTILHEFQPIIGVLKVRAHEEVPNWETSGVRTELEKLDRLLGAIESLKRAATAPKRRGVDLAALVKEIVQAENAGIHCSLVGPAPLIIETDPDLLRLAIVNGIRNAIEAVGSLAEVPDGFPVIISWGQTDIENWLTIIDSGPGITTSGAFKIGTTSKQKHIGMGLPIARQAMESLDGSIELAPDKNGGARLELRWYVS